MGGATRAAPPPHGVVHGILTIHPVNRKSRRELARRLTTERSKMLTHLLLLLLIVVLLDLKVKITIEKP